MHCLSPYARSGIEFGVLPARDGVILRGRPSVFAKKVGDITAGDFLLVRDVYGYWVRTQAGWALRSQVVGDLDVVRLSNVEPAPQNSPAKLVNRAAMFLRDYAIPDVKREISVALTVRPDYEPARLLDALIQVEFGGTERVIHHLSELIDRNRQFGLAYYHRASAWWKRQNYIEAKKDCDAAIRLLPHDPRPRLLRAELHNEVKQYQAALRDLELAAAIDPFDADMWHARGVTLFHMKDYAASAEAFSRSRRLRLPPNDHRGNRAAASWEYMNWGAASMMMRNFKDAIHFYSAALDLSQATPFQVTVVDEGMILCARGVAQLGARRYQDALDDLNKAIEYPRTRCSALLNRSAVFSALGDNSQAIHDCNLLLREQPASVDALNNRAEAFWRLGDVNSAINDLEFATFLDDRKLSAHSRLAHAYLSEGNIERAISVIDAVAAKMPESAEARCKRGLLFLRAGRYRQAAEDFAASCQFDPTNADYHAIHAWMLATCPDSEVRDGRRAVELASKACTMANRVSDWQVSVLAAAYAESGQFELAVQLADFAFYLGAADDTGCRMQNEVRRWCHKGQAYRFEPRPASIR